MTTITWLWRSPCASSKDPGKATLQKGQRGFALPLVMHLRHTACPQHSCTHAECEYKGLEVGSVYAAQTAQAASSGKKSTGWPFALHAADFHASAYGAVCNNVKKSKHADTRKQNALHWNTHEVMIYLKFAQKCGAIELRNCWKRA